MCSAAEGVVPIRATGIATSNRELESDRRFARVVRPFLFLILRMRFLARGNPSKCLENDQFFGWHDFRRQPLSA
jgi:hypothetical protein